MTKPLANKDKNLTWVYPPNGWVSDFNQTFVYGHTNPKAKLYVEIGSIHELTIRKIKIKIFPNGNFAQVIKLPYKKNAIRMIQVLNGKEKITTRNVIARRLSLSKPTKQSSHRVALIDCHASFHSARSPGRAGNDVLTICIDPGHGGKEHGTHSPKGIPEKKYNLQIAKMLVKALLETCGRKSPQRTKIYLTRNNDKYVSLDDRVKFAKKKKCNLFISIHHNALPDNENPLKHRGIGVYYTHDSVKPLAKKFLESICKEIKLKQYGLFKRNFRVTKQDFYTGVLIECGFLIHPLESEVITADKMQKKIVKGIKRIIEDAI
jgi:N-acetylmuramoyl-L-alanine amidase